MHGDIPQHNHLVGTVAKFKYALSTVRNSDIILYWGDGFAKTTSPNDRTTWSRIFMHCIAMLVEYSCQLMEVHLYNLKDCEYGFAKTFLSGLESPRKLQTLHIISCGAASSPGTSIDSNNFDEVLSSYNIGYSDPGLRLALSCPSLDTINFYNTRSPDLDALPSTL